MINIQKLTEQAIASGYNGANASAKVCQDIAFNDEGASLLINSEEQMFAEKLRSLLKFGPLSTRFKDVYDMYYLKDTVNEVELMSAIQIYIFDDVSMKEKDVKGIAKRLRFTFDDKNYIKHLDKTDKRWLDDDIKVITDGLLSFINGIDIRKE